MSNNCTARNDLLVALHTLASHFENALYAFGDDDEARKKAEGDIAWARLVASRHNYNGPECKEIERLRDELRERLSQDILDDALEEWKKENERLREENALLTKGWQPATPTALLDEIKRLRGLLRELINAENWLFDSARAEDLDRRVREALEE